MGQPEPGLLDSALKPSATSAESAGKEYIYDLGHFTLTDMVRCGSELRMLAAESSSFEEAAQRVTGYLCEHLVEEASNARCCVLVRLFKTHPYAGLSEDLQKFATSMAAGAAVTGETKCLTLLASAGDEPAWNSRRTSTRHQAIPLISEAIVEQFPMISQLIRQLGMTTAELLNNGPDILRALEQKKSGVFHVPVASGSPFIPAQKDFVAPYGVISVLGVGELLPDGEIFALIIFARVLIPVATADMFRTIALNLKLGILALLDKPVFTG
jgi:hypothetical protein